MFNSFRTCVCILTCFFVGSSSLSAREEIQTKEGWVVFATADYFPLLEVAIASVHAFSTRPVIAVGVNEDIPFSLEKYPQLIKKRIDVDLDARLPYFYKPLAILVANVEYGIYLDADAVLNQGCDALFAYTRLVEDYPLCPQHEDEAYVDWDTMDFFGVSSRSLHYVHNDVMLFSRKCQGFLTEWCDVCLRFPWLGVPVWDETLLNVLLWKWGATRLLFTCDPYNAYIYDYLEMSQEEISQPPYDQWFLFHGNKDPERGFVMLRDLQNKAARSFLK